MLYYSHLFRPLIILYSSCIDHTYHNAMLMSLVYQTNNDKITIIIIIAVIIITIIIAIIIIIIIITIIIAIIIIIVVIAISQNQKRDYL